MFDVNLATLITGGVLANLMLVYGIMYGLTWYRAEEHAARYDDIRLASMILDLDPFQQIDNVRYDNV